MLCGFYRTLKSGKMLQKDKRFSQFPPGLEPFFSTEHKNCTVQLKKPPKKKEKILASASFALWRGCCLRWWEREWFEVAGCCGGDTGCGGGGGREGVGDFAEEGFDVVSGLCGV